MIIFVLLLLFVAAIGVKAADKLALIVVCGAIAAIPLFVLFIFALCWPPLAWGLGAAAVVGVIGGVIQKIYGN